MIIDEHYHGISEAAWRALSMADKFIVMRRRRADIMARI